MVKQCVRCDREFEATRWQKRCSTCIDLPKPSRMPRPPGTITTKPCRRCGGTFEGELHRKTCDSCKNIPRVRSEAHKDYMAQYQKDNRKAEDQRWYKIKNRYGLTEAEWWLMLEAQEWACLICSKPWKESDPVRNWHTDHKHNGTKNVRGILCSLCNRGLGQFQDSPNLLRQAAAYLERG